MSDMAAPANPADLKPVATPAAVVTPAPNPTSTPIKIREPKILIEETQIVIKKLQELLKSKVLCYFTVPESSINGEHPGIFLDQLRAMGKQETISLVVISNGGDSSSSLRIAYALRDYCKNLNVLVPSTCASAATVLALAADQIIMGPTGYLTAIDTSLTHPINPKGGDGKPVAVGVDQVKRLLKFLNDEGPAITDQNKEGSYRTLFRYFHPLTLAEIDRISSRTILVATKMMQMHSQSFTGQEQIDWIAQHLYNDYPEHGFPILYKEADEIGLPVVKADEAVSDLMRDLINHYYVITNEAVTHYSDNRYHFNRFTNLLESEDSRIEWLASYDRFLNPITKTWQYENDISKWVNIIPPSEKNPKIKILPLNYRMDMVHEASDEESITPPFGNPS